MAWILGNFIADGCVSDYKDTKNASLKMCWGVAIRDKIIVEFIANKLNTVVRERSHFLKSTGGIYLSVYTEMRSNIMGDKLAEFGVTPRKTGKEFIPIETPHQYMPSLIRGYFDGDGCIFRDKYPKTNTFRCKITSGAPGILEQIKNMFKFGNVNKRGIGKTHDWQFAKLENIIQFADYIYSTPGFYLPRKFEKFEEAREVYAGRVARKQLLPAAV